MQEAEKLKVHVKINSRYPVFDQSGRLPFSIIFGLRRRSPGDTDSRPTVLDTSGSMFDVPFALANGLLRLYRDQNRQKEEVDMSSLHAVAAEPCHISLGPWTREQTDRRRGFETYECRIDAENEVAWMLRPHAKYVVRLASKQLSVRWWAYGEPAELLMEDPRPNCASSSAALVNSKDSAGKAAFKTEPSLPWPPRVEVHVRMNSQASSSDQVRESLSQQLLRLPPMAIVLRAGNGGKYVIEASHLFSGSVNDAHS